MCGIERHDCTYLHLQLPCTAGSLGWQRQRSPSKEATLFPGVSKPYTLVAAALVTAP